MQSYKFFFIIPKNDEKIFKVFSFFTIFIPYWHDILQFSAAFLVIIYMVLRRLFIHFVFAMTAVAATAQERYVENRPYCDLRPFHLGVVVGTHWQDTEFENIGRHEIVDAEGNVSEAIVTAEQDRWENGFQVGVLGELRLDQHFALRIAPTIYFGNRHFSFRNFLEKDIYGNPAIEQQDLKSAFIGCNADIIFAAKRFNNHRPYIMVGMNPMFNLTSRDNDYLQMSRTSMFFEVGLGCDFYLPFFKLRPELKFMYSLGNTLNADHYKDLRNEAMLPYASSVKKATTKVIALTFYFE